MTMTAKTGGGIGRRDFIATAARGVCGAAVFGFSLMAMARSAKSLPTTALRPPGAISEDRFLGACVRCGLCVRDCPYNTLKLADLGDGPANGTPYFTAREVPCEMCDDIPCVVACPTGALDHSLTNIDDARMGAAVLVGHETCLNYLGLRCDVCYRVCPLIDEAITLEQMANTRTGKHAMFVPVVHTDKCTGCGKCERSCVLEEAAIKVLPSRVAVTHNDAHYRRGWEEKQKEGKALIDGIIDLPDRNYAPAQTNWEKVDPNYKPFKGGIREFKP